jgi:hypothetical protein
MNQIKESAKKSAKGRIECFVLSVKNSTTTQRTAIKSKWMEYRVTSTMIWALKLVKNWRSTLRSLFDMVTKKLVVFVRESVTKNARMLSKILVVFVRESVTKNISGFY